MSETKAAFADRTMRSLKKIFYRYMENSGYKNIHKWTQFVTTLNSRRNCSIDNKEFRLVQKLTRREAHFNQFMRLRNQLVNTAENFARVENLTPVLIPTTSKDKDEQLKLAHKVVDVVDRANRKICVTLLRYNVDKPESSYAQVQLFVGKMEDEKFQQVVHVNFKLEEFIYLLDVMVSV